MDWLNIYGLIFISAIMLPNIVYAIRCRDGFINKWQNKKAELIENIGRYGCFAFMGINVPYTCFGFWSDEAFVIYLVVNTVLVALYCLVWIFCFRGSSVFRALALSVLPSLVFLSNGILSGSVLLIISALMFAPAHITISYKNSDK